jgi:hypothetical protein
MKAAIVYRKQRKYLIIIAPIGQYRYDSTSMKRGLDFTIAFTARHVVIKYDLSRYILTSMDEESIRFLDNIHVQHRMFIPLK